MYKITIMGAKQSSQITNSFFLNNELEQLKLKFEEYNKNPIFALDAFPDFSIKVHNFMRSQIKSPKDFKSFVGILEYMIYGKSNTIQITGSTSIDILISILSLPEDTLIKTLPQILLSLCENEADISEFINLSFSDIKTFVNYLIHDFPVLSSSFSRYIRSKVLNTALPKPPSIPIKDRNISKVLNLLYYSSNKISGINSELHRIYLSDVDGLGFKSLSNAVLGYSGPMILVIKLQNNFIIGAYIGESFKDNAMISGSMDTFLYSLDGNLKVFRTFKPEFGPGGGKYIYFNSKLQNSTKFPKGLGFGGDKEEARL